MAPWSRLGSTALGLSLAVACRTPGDAAEPASAPPPPAMSFAGTPRPPSPRTPAPAATTAPSTAGLPVAQASAAAPTARRTYVVAAIGDSLTDFRSHGGGYLKDLQQRCPESRFDSYGKGGNMVNQMRRRIGKELFDHPAAPYTHLIVFGGVNDLYSDQTAGRTVAKITRDLSAMYEAAHRHGMKVVAMTIAPWGGFSRYFTEARGKTTLELNRWISDQQKTGAADFVVDTYPLLSCGDPQKLCDALQKPFHDGLHFGPAGHQKVADALYETVFSDCR